VKEHERKKRKKPTKTSGLFLKPEEPKLSQLMGGGQVILLGSAPY
jgi:hypothetical protein